MNKSALQVELCPSWKEEVHRKVAAHKSRKNGLAVDGSENPNGPKGARRGSDAAARVAERFANAPSYNEALAEEARTAVRAAAAATRAARQAQEAAQSLFASLEAVAEAEQSYEPLPEPEPVRSAPRERVRTSEIHPTVPNPNLDHAAYGVRWEADFPVHQQNHGAARALAIEEHWDPTGFGDNAGELVEPGPVTHANVIEFPSELVATRKMRPRRAEGGYAAAEAEAQLSIFEVDPASVSTVPEAPETAASVWTGWPAVSLERVEAPAEMLPEPMPVQAAASVAVDLDEPVASAAVVLEVAPMNRRVLAAFVDGLLIVGATLGAAFAAMNKMTDLPAVHDAAMSAGLLLAAITVVYKVIFFTLGASTPGMRYARIALQTLENKQTNLGERWKRLFALVISLAPAGLGVVWSLFDAKSLSWHDRLSGTYLRRA